MGFAGAVAFAGLMSAGVQTAQAQLELVPNPGGSGSLANPQVSATSGGYNYTYYMGIVNGATNATVFTLSNLDNGAATPGSTASDGLNYSGAGYTGSILNNFFQISDFNGYVSDATNTANWGTYNGATTPTGTTIQLTANDWTLVQTGSTLTMYYIGPNLQVSPGNTDLIGAFTFKSTIGPGSVPRNNFDSTINNGGAGTQPPVINVNTGVEVPSLPLPAAFWPGLLTIGGMAVVGGLRMRRRTV